MAHKLLDLPSPNGPSLPLAEVREPGPRRSRFRVLTAVIAGYLLAAALTVPVAEIAPRHGWIALHLLLLGAATNAIVVFGRHFAQALLHTRGGSERAAAVRLGVLNTGVVAVLVGVSWPQPVAVAGGAGLVTVAVLAHVVALVRMDRAAVLAGRLRVVVRYHVAAGLALVAGALIGAMLGTGWGSSSVPHTALHLAHVHLNLLGWVGLTVLGTAFMLWPAVLRTRMADDAPLVARRVLVVAITAVVLTAGGFLAQRPVVAGAGLLAYAAAVAWSLVPAVRAARRKPPRSAAAVQLAAATGWLLVALVVDAVAALRGPAAALEALSTLVPLLGLGFVAQVLVAALTFLVPVTVGGGPAGNRHLTAVLETWWPARVALTNAGVLLLALPLSMAATAFGWAIGLVGLASFVPLLVLVLAQRPVAAAPGTGAARPSPSTPTTRTGLVTSLSLLTVVAVLGLVVTGAWPRTEPVSAAPTGGVVAVELVDVAVSPAVVTVPAGERLVLEVRNAGQMRHDLRVEGGPSTPMLAPGSIAVLDVGVVTEDREAWCTVGGHRQAGMTLQIQVTTGDSGHGHGTGAGHAHEHGTDVAPAPDWEPYDPTLQPAPDGTVHEVTLEVEEADIEVAPGVRQRMWTFGGTVPGPVLRGRVGDVFHVRLVNTGTLPHSVDFHASRVAPDDLMRSIEPGEELVYSFRAEHAGAWLYHCGTAPMLQHVAMGMYGAVVIDPPGLSAVDRELVLVQSEVYLGKDGRIPELAPLQSADYDLVTFNGYADQYTRAPIRVRAGERIRVWVVDAGPNASSAFHVVGTQFDTVYREGAYTLRPDDGTGAAQVLDLAPAQGGFVEFTLPEPGRYPLVSHRLADADRGASGLLLAE